MSRLTDRLYLSWLRSNGCTQARRGYGAQPHGQRREGYPTGQINSFEAANVRTQSEARRLTGCHSRDGSPRANDAASRPEKPEVQNVSSALFLPGAEKSSIKSKA